MSTKSRSKGVDFNNPLLVQQLRILLSDAKTSLFISIGIAVLGSLILYPSLQSAAMHWWMGSTVLALLARALFCAAYSRQETRDRFATHQWACLYLAQVAMSGVLWGSLILFWNTSLPDSTQLQLFLFPITLAAGAVSAYGTWMPAYLAFLIPCLLPVILILLFGNSAGYASTALPACAYFGGLVVLGANYQAKIKEAISLKHDKSKLAEDLSVQNDLLRSAKEVAESANLVKSEFLARVSHELRTPMNGVLGMTQVLKTTQLTDQQKNLNETIEASAESLRDIIDDVLDLSELNADKLRLISAEISTRELLADVVAQFEEVINAKGLAFSIAIDVGTPDIVRGDYTRLKQILSCLLSNAVKFTDSGFVRLKFQLREQFGSRCELVFTVSDSGKGIADDHHQLIFESFSQTDNTSTREHQGAGLGLTVAAKLAQLMQGELSVKSTLGRGSIFTFSVWLDQGAAAAKGFGEQDGSSSERSGLPAGTIEGARVLLVEDSEINQAVASALLENMGCIITLAENGQEAVDNVTKFEFDLVLMDCQMPVMDGYAATKAIRKLDKNNDIRIVALTANAMQGDREKCLQAGMDEYLSKPFKAEELETIIGVVLGSGISADTLNENDRRSEVMTPENTEKVLDSATLDNLRLLDKGKGLICRVIDAFNSSMPKLMNELQIGVAEQDKDKISMPAHTMKSSAANLGALAFSKQCAVIETLAREGNLAPVAAEFEVLQGLLEPIVTELAQERAEAEARRAA